MCLVMYDCHRVEQKQGNVYATVHCEILVDGLSAICRQVLTLIYLFLTHKSTIFCDFVLLVHVTF